MSIRQSAAATCSVQAPTSIDRRALEAYATWLFYERRILCKELYPGLKDPDALVMSNEVEHFHMPSVRDSRGWSDRPLPSSRAEGMLASLGVDWSAHKQRVLGPALASAAASVSAPVGAGFPHPDADLIAAEAHHRNLCNATAEDVEMDGEVVALDVAIERLESRIVRSPARTIEGLQAKARLLRRVIVGCDKETDRCPNPGDEVERMAWSIMADLLGIATDVDAVVAG